MCALVISPRYGVPLDVYLSQRGNLPAQICSIQAVQSAVQKLTSGDHENVSESTLEAALSVVYYPEHLYSLVNNCIIPAACNILKRYPVGVSVGLYTFAVYTVLIDVLTGFRGFHRISYHTSSCACHCDRVSRRE